MKKSFFSVVLAALCAVGLMSCKDNKGLDTTKATVQVTNHPTLGKLITDNAGRTLYFFSRDTKGASVCTGDCLAAWPIFYSEYVTTESADLTLTDFTTITRDDGKKQTVYKGFPLYYFNLDTQPGDTKGENTQNIWFVAKPDYSVMYSKAQLVGHDGQSYKSDYTQGVEETSYMTGAKGRIVYTFTLDKNNTNNFTTNSANNPAVWPIFPSVAPLVVPSIFNKADFGEITVNGQKQLTYKGWPLYYFGGNATVPGDVNKGDTRGISFPAPGVWHVANTSTIVAPL